jgi:HEPN domain-containing protein
MAKNIEPTLKLISKYLKLEKSENFVIPEYQRGYSWDITQCDKLWQDIEAFISSNASDPYFFGTIIVDCSETNKFSLIDGQQRTTTFLLLLKALLIRLTEAIPKVPDDEESEALKAGLKANRNKIMAILYKAEDEDIPAMLKDYTKTQNILILENKSINELFPKEVKTIIEATDFKTSEQNVYKIPRKQKDNKYTNHFRNFKYFFEKLGEKSESQLNQFAKIFLEKCQVIEIRSWQIEQAITMFNSLNSTGMPLSDADIISAQLYSNAGDNKKTFNDQWESINQLANELSGRKIIDLDAVLQQFMYINRAINKEYISINKEGNESVDVTTPGLRRYYTDIRKELLSEPLTLCNNLTKITNIWNTVKDYPTVKLLLKCNENAKLFLSGYLYRYELTEITEENILDLCECLLRLFTVLELSDAGYSSSKFKTFLFSQNIKFVDKAVSIDTIKKEFNDHINNNWKQDTIADAIIEYDKNLLVFLNEYIYAKNKGTKFDFAENVNIEHIMPSSGRNLTTIQQDAKIATKEEFNGIVNKLGNKILLEEDINKSIGNEWFKTKKQNSINSKSGYKDSRYGIALALTAYPKDTWTKDDIDNATIKAAERIVKFIFNT